MSSVSLVDGGGGGGGTGDGGGFVKSVRPPPSAFAGEVKEPIEIDEQKIVTGQEKEDGVWVGEEEEEEQRG